MAALFSLGVVVATPRALELLRETGPNPAKLLDRHAAAGDWGKVPPEYAHENTPSIQEGFRISSSYPVGDAGGRVWIITEAERSSTRILLPEIYSGAYQGLTCKNVFAINVVVVEKTFLQY